MFQGSFSAETGIAYSLQYRDLLMFVEEVRVRDCRSLKNYENCFDANCPFYAGLHTLMLPYDENFRYQVSCDQIK